MKCKFCQEELPQGAETCPNCGIPVRSAHQQTASVPAPDAATEATSYRTSQQIQESQMPEEVDSPETRYERIERTSRRNRVIAICTTLVLLIGLVSGYIYFFTGYRTAIRRYVDGRATLSGARYSAIVPDAFLSQMTSSYDMNRKEIRNCLDSYFAFAREQMEDDLGTNIRFTYERDTATTYTDAETLATYEEELLSTYSVNMTLDKVVLANVRISTAGNNSNATDSVTLTLFKSGMKWYCMDAMEQIDYACQYEGYNLW